MENRNQKTREELNKLNAEFKSAIDDSKKWSQIDFKQEYELLSAVSSLNFMNKHLTKCNNLCEKQGLGEYFGKHHFEGACYANCYMKVYEAQKYINQTFESIQ